MDDSFDDLPPGVSFTQSTNTPSGGHTDRQPTDTRVTPGDHTGTEDDRKVLHSTPLFGGTLYFQLLCLFNVSQ